MNSRRNKKQFMLSHQLGESSLTKFFLGDWTSEIAQVAFFIDNLYIDPAYRLEGYIISSG